MPKEIFPSSFECDCGHQSDFFERTVNELKKLSLKKRQLLGDSDDHIIVFEGGKMVEIRCPHLGKKGQSVKQKEKEVSTKTSASKKKKSNPRKATPKVPYTPLQAQYLALIHYFNLVNGQPPAHSDFQRYFRTTPPSVNQMLKTLEKKGLISKVPGKPRAISLLVSRDELPDLEPVST